MVDNGSFPAVVAGKHTTHTHTECTSAPNGESVVRERSAMEERRRERGKRKVGLWVKGRRDDEGR